MADPLDGGRRVVRGVRGEVEVDDEQLLLELRAAGEHRAVGGHDDRVAVEDQVVLAADHVDVGERAAGLGRPAGDELAAHVVLVALVGRAVDDEQELGAGAAGQRHGAAVLPDVLADDDGDVDPADAHDGEVARPA